MAGEEWYGRPVGRPCTCVILLLVSEFQYLKKEKRKNMASGGGGGKVESPQLDSNSKEGKEEILRVFQDMTKQRDQMQEKISELLVQYSEYKRVADTLEPLEKDKKAWHLVNSVLIERNVGEVLPVVLANRDGLQQLQATLTERLKKLQLEIKEFSTKYNGG